MKDNQLQVILTEQNVGQENAKKLIEAFGAPFEEAGEILSTYQEIKVTGHKQVTLMQEARDKRLALKKIRTGVENRRKELKEDALKAGRAIDAVARYVKETIQPAEEYLQLQEDFAKIEAEKAAAEKRSQRLARLSPLVADPSLYNIDAMNDDQFEELIEDRKQAKKFAEEEQAKREAEAEKARKAEEKRIADQAKENARLKAEAVEKDKKERKVRERINRLGNIGMVWNSANGEYAQQGIHRAFTMAQVEQMPDDEFEKACDEVTNIVFEQNQREAEKRKAEAKKARELEEEKRKRDEADAKAKVDADAAEKAALLAPDKDKLIAYAKSLGELPVPMLETEEAQAVMNNARNYVNTVAEKMTEKANTL